LVHALLYTRVSGAEHQKEGLSLEAQARSTRGYAAVQPGWVIAGEYRDILSGGRDDRPDYQALLAEARRLHRSGSRAAVVVTRLDRLGRHLLEQVRAREELKSLGCDTHAIKEGGMLSDLTAHILMSVGQDERQRIGARVAEVRSDLVRSGWHYGKTPFGYRKRPATAEERLAGSPRTVLETDPAARAVVAEVFERIAEGKSIISTARWLAGLPEAMRGGRRWPASCVNTMLRSPTYAARPAEGVDDVLARPRARWEPIVSDQLWGAAGARIDEHVSRPHQASGRFLLTGFARCPICGERMVGAELYRSDRGDIRRGYRCTGWTRGANAPVQNCRFSVPMRQADELVLSQVGDMLSALVDPDVTAQLREKWNALNQPSDTSGRVADLEREIKTAQRRLADSAALLVDGTLDRLGYEALRDRETDRIRAAEGELSRLNAAAQPKQAQLPPLSTIIERAGSWARILREIDVTHQRPILNELIDRVSLSRTGYRAYAAAIEWTSLGLALRAVTARNGTHKANVGSILDGRPGGS
jgi:DNA invertase Pin-like site-specific DNA recombinase